MNTPPPDPLLKGHLPIYLSAAADDAGLGVHAFRVLARICRRWSEAEGCYESVGNMAKACRMKDETAARALNELESRGMIRRTKRNGQTSRIDPQPADSWQPPTPRNGATSKKGVPPKKGQPPTPRNGVPPTPNGGAQREPTKGTNEGNPIPPKSPEGDGGGFDAFWTAFPKKRGKAKARTAYAKAVRGAPDLPAVLLADVARRQTDDYRWTKEDGRYIPDPTTYLNQERWHDEYQPTPKLSAVNAERERAAAARANPRAEFERGAVEALAAIDPGFAGMAGARVDESHRLSG